ncbi:MAG: hypothetical protein JO127_17555 [Caulobacteraceae bacterium]|nr:hypothetical protein [Caulobacteraceae bacterium]
MNIAPVPVFRPCIPIPFSWSDVAVSAVAASATYGVSKALPFNGPAGSLGGFANHLVSGAAGAIAASATNSLLTGQDFGQNLQNTLPSIIGQTIGNLIGAAESQQQDSFAEAKKFGADKNEPMPNWLGDASPASGPDRGLLNNYGNAPQFTLADQFGAVSVGSATNLNAISGERAIGTGPIVNSDPLTEIRMAGGSILENTGPRQEGAVSFGLSPSMSGGYAGNYVYSTITLGVPAPSGKVPEISFWDYGFGIHSHPDVLIGYPNASEQDFTSLASDIDRGNGWDARVDTLAIVAGNGNMSIYSTASSLATLRIDVQKQAVIVGTTPGWVKIWRYHTTALQPR